MAGAGSPAKLMITISTEKGLISKIESWKAIEERPGFNRSLDPTKHELASIIGRYKFEDKVPCGLSNCHTLHSKGYIVATKDGRETNIGKDCGKTYFGVDFEVQSAQFDRDITEQENREHLWSFLAKVPEIEGKIEALRKEPKGADWVYKHSDPLINSSTRCPKDISRRLSDMVKTKSNIFSLTRMATAQEVEDMEERQGKKLQRPQYIDEPVCQILGIEALYPENNLRSLLVLDLENNLKTFKAKDIDQMTYEELSRWKKWSGTIEKILETASRVITLGNQLLSNSNLRPLVKVLKEPEDISCFDEYLKGLSQ